MILSDLIVHRDLKPHNILLSLLSPENEERYRAKISDFGVSKKYRPDQTRSSTGQKGTDGWTAPEVFQVSYCHIYQQVALATHTLKIAHWTLIS